MRNPFDDIKEPDLTPEQAKYISYLNNPPKFYCQNYSNAEDECKYCANQCFDCVAVVGETRRKNAL